MLHTEGEGGVRGRVDTRRIYTKINARITTFTQFPMQLGGWGPGVVGGNDIDMYTIGPKCKSSTKVLGMNNIIIVMHNCSGKLCYTEGWLLQ